MMVDILLNKETIIYLDCNISSTKSYVNLRIGKA